MRSTIRGAAKYLRSLAIRAGLVHPSQDISNSRPLHQRQTYWNEALGLTLMDLVHETETRASGRVQIISLADFRESIGDLWERYRDRIILIAESTIDRSIGKGNTFIAQGEDTWLLLFPGLSEGEAQSITDAIAAIIGDKLMGTNFAPHEAPLPATARLDLSGTINADGSVNIEALKKAVGRARTAGGTKPAESGAIGGAAPSGAASNSPGGRSGDRRRAPMIASLFLPAWSAETEVLDSFFCRPALPGRTNLESLAAGSLDEEDYVHFLRSGIEAFNDMINAGLKAKFAMPVPFSLLQGKSLAHVQRIVANLPQRERLLHFRIEVVHIPAPAGADVLVEVRERFRPFVREVLFSTNPIAPNEKVLALDHVMIGGELESRENMSSDDLFQALLHFRQLAGRRPTFVQGLGSPSQVASAIRAGIREVSGSGLSDALRHFPERLSTRRREDLIGQ